MKLDCNILHLEDDDNDSFFFERALEKLQFTGEYRRIASVPDAISYLTGEKSFSNRDIYPMPHVLVLDSALKAGKTTCYLMEWLAQQEKYSHLIRVVLAGEINEEKKSKWMSGGAACVLAKGATLEDLTNSIKTILQHADCFQSTSS